MYILFYSCNGIIYLVNRTGTLEDQVAIPSSSDEEQEPLSPELFIDDNEGEQDQCKYSNATELNPSRVANCIMQFG